MRHGHDSLELSPSSTASMPFGKDHPSVWSLLLNMMVYIISSLQLWVSWQFEWFHAAIFSLVCFSTRTPSRNAFVPAHSAVVVMGGGEGLGRMLSLRLASAGYTVFACLPHDVPTPRGTGSHSSISPLLYIWQSRKARNALSRQPSGTIVPLVFDASLADDCERAKDTILAYCNRHSVVLRTLLIPPITPTPRSGFSSGNVSPIASSAASGIVWKQPKGRLASTTPLIQTSQTSMHDAMSKAIFQPLGMIQALAGILHEARSQVLFISGCDETSFRPSQGVNALCDAARDRTARTLQSELGPLGVQVSHIMMGPLQTKSIQVINTEPATSIARRLLCAVSLLWAIDERTCFKLVHSAIEARYPRSSYRFGLDIFLQDFAEAYLPTNVLDLAKRAVPVAVKYLDSF